MVKVKFTFRGGRTKVSNFPNATLKDVKYSAKRINPKIKKVEYAPRKKTHRR